jgi:predicted acylesterase/phospholipase RssA
MRELPPDPTNDPSLQTLRDEIEGNQQVREYLGLMNYSRCALVFSGGGGKGAYEAGVVLALFDCGVRKFKVISGTSVGALNAVLCNLLCRTGNRDLVLNTWCQISYGKVNFRLLYQRQAIK